MSISHTPGPWMASSTDAPEQGVYGCGYRVARMYGGEIQRDIANARLIAAAPDLLAALQHAVRRHDQLNPDDLTEFKAAIAKATGSAA